MTSDSAWVMLGWEKFWLKRGIIYFFNNGFVHSAGNSGYETRYHLVFDCMLNEKLFNEFLTDENKENPDPDLLSIIPKEQIEKLMHAEPCEITNFEDQRKGLKNKLLSRFRS